MHYIKILKAATFLLHNTRTKSIRKRQVLRIDSTYFEYYAIFNYKMLYYARNLFLLNSYKYSFIFFIKFICNNLSFQYEDLHTTINFNNIITKTHKKTSTFCSGI